MSIGQLRHAVMAAARWLAKHGGLADPEDVLWLRFQEILDALRTDSPSEFTALIATRQAEHRAWLHLKAPAIVGIPACQLPERPPLQDEVTLGSDGITPDNTGRLLGLGASPGQRRGKARIMHDPLSLPAQLAPGDILVAENVGPLWTPIFPMLGGLVLESGAVGQHAAATAREYGVPTVIHVKQARQRIPDESWILVDGTEGLIELGDWEIGRLGDFDKLNHPITQ